MSTELTPRQVLVNAKALLIDPSHWGQGNLASGSGHDFYFIPTEVNELPAGVKVCTLGAVEFSLPLAQRGWTDQDGEYPTRTAAMRYICRAAGLDTTLVGIPNWNDVKERTHAEVIDVLDRAILLAAADEGFPFEPVESTDGVDVGPEAAAAR